MDGHFFMNFSGKQGGVRWLAEGSAFFNIQKMYVYLIFICLSTYVKESTYVHYVPLSRANPSPSNFAQTSPPTRGRFLTEV